MNSKTKLIEAMGELIALKGLSATSPKDILTRAQVGHGSFYHYFSGKDDLALAGIQYNADKLVSATRELFDSEENAYKKISAFLKKPRNVQAGCILGNLAKDHKIMSDAKLKRPIVETFEWLQATLEKILKDGIKKGEINPLFEPKSTAIAIIAIIQGGYVNARAFQSDEYFVAGTHWLLKLLKV